MRQSVHTVGQSDATFWRNDGASVLTCPAAGRSDGSIALSDANGGKSWATNCRSGATLKRTCPKVGKPPEADARMYWRVVRIWDTAGHQCGGDERRWPGNQPPVSLAPPREPGQPMKMPQHYPTKRRKKVAVFALRKPAPRRAVRKRSRSFQAARKLKRFVPPADARAGLPQRGNRYLGSAMLTK